MKKVIHFILIVNLLLPSAALFAQEQASGGDFSFKLPEVIITGENELKLKAEGKRTDYSDVLMEMDLAQLTQSVLLPLPPEEQPFAILGEKLFQKKDYFMLKAGAGFLPEGEWSLLRGQDLGQWNYSFALNQEANSGLSTGAGKDGWNLFNGSLRATDQLDPQRSIRMGAAGGLQGEDLPYSASPGDNQNSWTALGFAGFDAKEETYDFSVDFSADKIHRQDSNYGEDINSYNLIQNYFLPFDWFIPSSLGFEERAEARWMEWDGGAGTPQPLPAGSQAGSALVFDGKGDMSRPFWGELMAALSSHPLDPLNIKVGAFFAQYQSVNSSNDKLDLFGKAVWDLDMQDKLFVLYQPSMAAPDLYGLYLSRNYARLNTSLLAPERLYHWELGVESHLAGGVDLGASYFCTQWRNFIALSGPDPSFQWLPQNIDSVNQQGLHLTAKIDLYPSWRLGSDYHWTSTQDGESAGPEVPYFPEHEAEVSMNYDHEEWSGELLGHWVGQRYSSDLGNSLAPYFIVDLSVERCGLLPGLSIWIKGKNLLAQGYQIWQGYAEPGMTGLAGFTLRL